MVQAGEDVTFIDPWPEHVEHMRKHGLRVTHAKDVAEFSVPVRALHVTDVQQLAREKPVDIAFVCMKSYDTAWATMMIQQYLAPDNGCGSRHLRAPDPCRTRHTGSGSR
jgi:2-dehydropantoate 2-reductase